MGPHTILVVEDEPDVRDFAVETLRDAGYAVLEAPTGPDAIRLFEEHPEIDVVFTDIVMPGLDGFKLADIAKLRRPAVRILYATGFMDQARDHLGVIHGAVLRKPYRLTVLCDAIAATLAAPTVPAK
jgi:CheY-like chemotaxis protein